jgi:hypothetical protein
MSGAVRSSLDVLLFVILVVLFHLTCRWLNDLFRFLSSLFGNTSCLRHGRKLLMAERRKRVWRWRSMMILFPSSLDRISFGVRRWRSTMVVNIIHPRSVLFRSRLLDRAILIIPFSRSLNRHVLRLLLPFPLCGFGGHSRRYWRRGTSSDAVILWLLVVTVVRISRTG